MRGCLVLVSFIVSAGTHFSCAELAMQLMGPVSDSLHHLLLLVKQACSSHSGTFLRHQEWMQQSASQVSMQQEKSCAPPCNHVHHTHEASTVPEQPVCPCCTLFRLR